MYEPQSFAVYPVNKDGQLPAPHGFRTSSRVGHLLTGPQLEQLPGVR